MILIGEKLNSSIPTVFEAYSKNDLEFVKRVAQGQLEGGAEYLDVNTAACGDDEIEKMLWVTENVNAKFMLDSPSADVLDRVLGQGSFKDVIINSITLEKARFDSVLPLIGKYNTKIVALPVSDDGIPANADARFDVAVRLVEALHDAGVGDDRIFVDALVETLGTNWQSGAYVLDTIRRVRERYPNIHITGGLSNASFGLPKRGVINSAVLTCAVTCGLDSAIVDTMSKDLRLRLAAAMLVNGKDEYCMSYIETFRDIE